MQLNIDRTTRLHLLLIVLATFLAYGVVLTGYFIADDTWQLQFGYRVLHHGEWSLVFGNFVKSYLSLPSMDFYRPLLGLSYLLDYAIYGTWAAGFYVSNILMAACGGVLLYFIARAIMPDVDRDRANFFALSSALLFVVSPLHCEDVCWISGRADLLAAPFFLGSLLAAIYGRNWATGKINWIYYAISLVTYLLSLLSKESPVTLPLVVAALFVLAPVFAARDRQPAGAGRRGEDQGPAADGPVSDGKDQRNRKRKKSKGGKHKPPSEVAASPAGEGQAEESKRDSRRDWKIDHGRIGALTEGAGNKKADAGKNAGTKDSAGNNFPGSIAAGAEPGKPARTEGMERSAGLNLDWSFFVKQFLPFLVPYGAITFAYLIVRRHALGSFIGGYTGDMGEALSRWLLFRWFDPVNLVRMAFPISKENFHAIGQSPDTVPAIPILGTVYATILGLLVVRLLAQKINLRVPFFVCLWLLASLVPLFMLWGMDASLHNQRVLYLYTAPMVMLLPAIIFSPTIGDRPSMRKQYLVLNSDMEDALCEACAWCFYALAACLIVISALVSCNWREAGLQIQAIQQKTTALIENLSEEPDKKILVVRVPKDYLGAHVLMGGVNMIELLEPPFIKQPISQYMISFQRALVGPAEPVSAARFKQELSSLKDQKAYFWELEKRDYKVVRYDQPTVDRPEKLPLKIAAAADQAGKPGVWYPVPAKKGSYAKSGSEPVIEFTKLNDTGGDGMMIYGLDINPLAFDYFNLTVSMPHAPTASGIYLSFDDREDAKTPFVEKPQICRMLQLRDVPPGGVLKERALKIRLSHFGDWFSFKRIRRLKLSFSNVEAINVSRLGLMDDRKLKTDLRVIGGVSKPNGEYVCGSSPVQFEASSPGIDGVKSCQVDISKVNQSWDTFVATNAHGEDQVVNKSFRLPVVDGKAAFPLNPEFYAENGFYDVRVVMLDDKNQAISDWSDLITLYRPDPSGAKAPFSPDY